jgi:hypothetical protein
MTRMDARDSFPICRGMFIVLLLIGGTVLVKSRERQRGALLPSLPARHAPPRTTSGTPFQPVLLPGGRPECKKEFPNTIRH